MAKTCLNKLSGNFVVNCNLPAHGVKNLYLIHIEDVTLGFSAGGEQISSITFAEGAKAYKVEGEDQVPDCPLLRRSHRPSD